MSHQFCDHHSVCLNNHSCYRCRDMHLLKRHGLPVGLKKTKTHSSWRRLEVSVANKLKSAGPCRLQPASGSKWYAPGDVISPEILTECKSHPVSARGSKQHTISRRDLLKIAEEAALSGRMPLYAFQFKSDPVVYAVLRLDDLETLLQNRVSR